MKKILVTGASGLLGLNFSLLFYRKYQIVGISNRTKLKNVPFDVIYCDLLKEDPGALLDQYKPEVVLHCAAMANIDQCEKNPEDAERINSIYPGRLAKEAGDRNMKFIHISTDAVFDGENCGVTGYREEDKTNPISRYAETKLHGEENVLDRNPDALIARVNFYGWSTGGHRSLVEFFYNNLESGKQVNGFSDVFFNTLDVHDLSALLCELVDLDAKGIYHVFSSQFQSKYDFGVSVAKTFGFDAEKIHPVSWKDGGLTAKRSPNLIMNTDKLRVLLGHALPDQQQCMDQFYQDTKNGLRDRILKSVV